MLEDIISGEDDPEHLASLALGHLRVKIPQLRLGLGPRPERQSRECFPGNFHRFVHTATEKRSRENQRKRGLVKLDTFPQLGVHCTYIGCLVYVH